MSSARMVNVVFLAIVGMPLQFGACGFIVGAVATAFYNVSARWWGGITLEL